MRKQLPDNMIIRGRVIRLLPTAKEAKYLFDIADGCRKVWNWALTIQKDYYINNNTMYSWKQLNSDFTVYLNSNEGKELRNLPRKYLESAIQDLRNRFDRYFLELDRLTKEDKSLYSKRVLKRCAREKREPQFYERLWYPRFKKVGKCKIGFGCGDKSYFKYDKNTKELLGLKVVNLDKINGTTKEYNYLKLKTNYILPNTPREIQVKELHNPRIMYRHGKWIFSYGAMIPKKDVQVRKFNLGIDLGIRKEAVIAFANQIIMFTNINKSPYMKQLERRLKHIDRNIARKRKIYEKLHPNEPLVYSKALKDEYKKRAKLYYHISNIRKNYLHHITRYIINLLPNTIVYEDLKVANMRKNKFISKYINGAMWSTFRFMIERKAEEFKNIKLLVANRWYPSSKLCSCCGNKKINLGTEEIYTCSKCGLVIDRDVNAAKNLMSLASTNN